MFSRDRTWRDSAVVAALSLLAVAVPAGAETTSRVGIPGTAQSLSTRSPGDGLQVHVTAAKVGARGQATRLLVRLADDDASGYDVRVQFGDGTGQGIGQSAECLVPVPAGGVDRTLRFDHAYKRAGSYTVTATATTETCYTSLTGLGRETAAARTTIRVH
jgi:hypothetical protein